MTDTNKIRLRAVWDKNFSMWKIEKYRNGNWIPQAGKGIFYHTKTEACKQIKKMINGNAGLYES
jgi:hypothetical protein